MNLKHWVITAAIAAMPCATALAQNAGSASQATSSGSYTSNEASQWLASGFVGSNFANNAKPASMNFGGSLAYFWKNMLGVEFDTSFTPNFELQNRFVGTGVKPDINSYMANAIWAKPMGSDGQFQPFVSGGVGAISLRSGVGSGATMASSNDTRFGGDVGGGLMAFAGKWGFKADVQYLRATGTYNTVGAQNPTQPIGTAPTGPYILPIGASSTRSTMPGASVTTPSNAAAGSLASAALAGLHFWTASAGVAVRW